MYATNHLLFVVRPGNAARQGASKSYFSGRPALLFRKDFFNPHIIIETMQVTVNHKEVQTDANNVEALVAQLGLPAQGVAVAVAGKLVRRADWAAYALAEGAEITIVKAACGG